MLVYVWTALTIILPLVTLAVCARVLLRPHRDPASRIAWLVVVGVIPVVGVLAYLFLGEVRTGSRQRRELRGQTLLREWPEEIERLLPDRHRNLFRLGQSINGFPPVAGNSAALLADSNAAVDAMVADIDGATRQVHVDFYIWLADGNGIKMVQALCRAAQRGVTCRALADDLGSRVLVRSAHWQAMRDAGVDVRRALPIGNPLLQAFTGRIDVRNHRKIVVVDGSVTYCGSQNCADPDFLPKAKFAPWVDAMVRFEGPIVQQNQALFAADWALATHERLEDLDSVPPAPAGTSMPALAIGTGPTVRYSAMSEVFESLFFAARRQLVVTTPYYVPDEGLQSALCACAYRGVETILILPERNDSWIVAAASHSYYADLIRAGVKIHEYVGGLLHTKSITMDGEVTLIGSANLDRRSFELNFENNILVYDEALTQSVRQRQMDYIDHSKPVTAEDVDAWPMHRKLWNNAIATLGPLL
ncbi:cardiolipin synthase [Devosia epidermidihirudinis]|uniref:cardiolipin synthase n=1 Tax=Devosia epidermidihirudinis TaxID=1293439 RepID=UPI000B0BFD71|nr:cardiolipin synthase [Devosia epidermidihirudinis]